MLGPNFGGMNNLPSAFVQNLIRIIALGLAIDQRLCYHVSVVHPHNGGAGSAIYIFSESLHVRSERGFCRRLRILSAHGRKHSLVVST